MASVKKFKLDYSTEVNAKKHWLSDHWLTSETPKLETKSDRFITESKSSFSKESIGINDALSDHGPLTLMPQSTRDFSRVELEGGKVVFRCPFTDCLNCI